MPEPITQGAAVVLPHHAARPHHQPPHQGHLRFVDENSAAVDVVRVVSQVYLYFDLFIYCFIHLLMYWFINCCCSLC